eukprot:3204936-Prymnesium_polylepis.1
MRAVRSSPPRRDALPPPLAWSGCNTSEPPTSPRRPVTHTHRLGIVCASPHACPVRVRCPVDP